MSRQCNWRVISCICIEDVATILYMSLEWDVIGRLGSFDKPLAAPPDKYDRVEIANKIFQGLIGLDMNVNEMLVKVK